MRSGDQPTSRDIQGRTHSKTVKRREIANPPWPQWSRPLILWPTLHLKVLTQSLRTTASDRVPSPAPPHPGIADVATQPDESRAVPSTRCHVRQKYPSDRRLCAHTG